jgi:hypothetical protein
MNGIGLSCDILLVHDDNIALRLQQVLCSGPTVLRDVERYQESLCLGRYGKINRYWIAPYHQRNTQMYGQGTPIKAILDGSVAENQYTKPLMEVLRAMDEFWKYKSSKLEELLNRPKPGRISMMQRNGLGA